MTTTKKMQQLAMEIDRLEKKHGKDDPRTKAARDEYWRLLDQQAIDDTYAGFLAGTGRM